MYVTLSQKEQEYKLCTIQKSTLLEIRCDLTLLIEVRRHLEPYSKFSCISVKKITCSRLIFHLKVRVISILCYVLCHQTLDLYEILMGQYKGQTHIK